MKPENQSSGEKPSFFKELKRQVILTAETISKELKKSDDFAFRWVLWVGVVVVSINLFLSISSAAIERFTETYACTPEQKVVVNDSVNSCIKEFTQTELNREMQITLREKNELDNEITLKKMDIEALEKGLIKAGMAMQSLKGQSLALRKDDTSHIKVCTKSALKINCKLSVLGNEQ